ncbi:MAG: hypothetical protein RMN25_02335 [Anaerolineae bacterium]|nr:hypothetical protein [Thermoflexales bacterium]MDW8406594.1 hypothetical protein [Anaerolineae bacterium]
MTHRTTRKQAVYMVDGQGADAAIVRGLESSGCQITFAHGLAEALGAVFAVQERFAQLPILVAEVQADALSLLAVLAHQSWLQNPSTAIRPLPMQVVLFDRSGDDIQTAIRAIEYGVRAYLLARHSPVERELRVRLVAEEIR